jgi:hypothetical protein
MSGEELVILDPEKLVLEATLILRLGGVEHPVKLPRSLLEAFVDRLVDYGYRLVEEVLRDKSIFEMKLREGCRAGSVSNVSGRPLPQALPQAQAQVQVQAQARARRSRAELIYEFMFEKLSKEGRVYEDEVLRYVYGKDGRALPEYEVWEFRRLLDDVVRRRLERALGWTLRRTWDEARRAVYVLGERCRVTKTGVVEEVALSLLSRSKSFVLRDLVRECVEEFRRRGLRVGPKEEETVRAIWSVVRRRVEKRLGIVLEGRREGNYKVYHVVRERQGTGCFVVSGSS